MPRCYLLAVCRSSSIDQVSNNLSLFTMIEQLEAARESIPSEALSSLAPEVRPSVVFDTELHICWLFTEEELGRPFVIRYVVYESGEEVLAGAPYSFCITHASVSTPRPRAWTPA